VFVITALLCFHVRVAAGLELSAVHVNCVVVPLATTAADPFNATLKDGTERREFQSKLCIGTIG